MRSAIETIVALSLEERESFLTGLSEAEAESLLDEWTFWARPSQLMPRGAWSVWLAMAGRGWGKTRVGAEFIRARVRAGFKRLALVGPTHPDVRDVMVEGESGLLNLHWRRGERPEYIAHRRQVVWPNGAMAKMYSGEEPRRLRGPQHDSGWADEVAAWQYADAWDQLMFGMRLGIDPRTVATTTPKPVSVIMQLVAQSIPVEAIREGVQHDVVVTTGSTYENASNLAPQFLRQIRSRYEGTRLGRQELNAELLTEAQGALWTLQSIESQRRKDLTTVPEFVRVVVGVDPGGKSGKKAEEEGRATGIVTAALGKDGHFYVLGDASKTETPNGWAKLVKGAYEHHEADRVVAEKNFGGEMVESTIAAVDEKIPVRMVNASRGKEIRAEPVSALYEQGKVHHVGYFGDLESEMVTWVPALADKQPSPNRIDALVWAITELMGARSTKRATRAIGTESHGSPYDA